MTYKFKENDCERRVDASVEASCLNMHIPGSFRLTNQAHGTQTKCAFIQSHLF